MVMTMIKGWRRAPMPVIMVSARRGLSCSWYSVNDGAVRRRAVAGITDQRLKSGRGTNEVHILARTSTP